MNRISILAVALPAPLRSGRARKSARRVLEKVHAELAASVVRIHRRRRSKKSCTLPSSRRTGPRAGNHRKARARAGAA
jgi:hypothetical protein